MAIEFPHYMVYCYSSYYQLFYVIIYHDHVIILIVIELFYLKHPKMNYQKEYVSLIIVLYM